MKKRVLALVLSLMMGLCAVIPEVTAGEEDVLQHSLASQYDFDTLSVGCSTAFNGNFMNSLFGNNGSDTDVRELLHAYSPVDWVSAVGAYEINKMVVSNMMVGDDAEGNRTYRIFLCSDLVYSDGTSITAADYVFSILLSASPEIAEIGGVNPDLSYIVGAGAYMAGEADQLTGVRLIAENVFSVTVSKDALPNFYELSFIDFKPYPISVIAPGCSVKDDGNGAYLASDTASFNAEMLRETLLNETTGYVSHPAVVSGPYVLTSYDGETCEFELNPYFKGDMNGRKPVITHLTFKAYPTDKIVEALESGEIGLINKATNAQVLEGAFGLTRGGTYRMSSYPRSGSSFMSFACERIAVGEQAVRQAIAYCFDKDTAVAGYVGDYGLRVDGYYGIGQWMYTALNGASAAPIAEPDENASSAEMEAYEEKIAAFEALTMEDIPVYEQDIDQATKLLDENGWNLNENGTQYRAGADAVRYKAYTRQALEDAGQLEAALAQGGIETEMNGEASVLIPLQLTLSYPEGNTIADSLDEALIKPLAEAGIALELKAVPYPELLDLYYRRTARDTDLIYLATNFTISFDLSPVFSPEGAYQNMYNTTGIQDEELYEAACDLIRTEPGDVITYCEKWIKFQCLYQEKVPGIFVYSNVYFDFYTYALNEYKIAANITWSRAVVEAYMGDPLMEEEELIEEEEEFEDGDFEFFD